MSNKNVDIPAKILGESDVISGIKPSTSNAQSGVYGFPGRAAKQLIRWGLFGPLFRHAPFDAWIAHTVLSGPKPRTIPLEGSPITINCVNAEVLGFTRKWVLSQREQDARAWLDKLLDDDDVFLNVGAHIGLFALYANTLRKRIRTVCIEAAAQNASQVLSNIELNQISNVDVIHCAAGDTDGLAEFGLETSMPGYYNGRLVNDHYAGQRQNKLFEWVHVRSIDAVLAELSVTPTVMLMDIDGHEVMALKGMTDSLANPALRAAIIETNKHTADAVIDLMEEAGFSNAANSPDRRATVSNRLFVRD